MADGTPGGTARSKSPSVALADPALGAVVGGVGDSGALEVNVGVEVDKGASIVGDVIFSEGATVIGGAEVEALT